MQSHVGVAVHGAEIGTHDGGSVMGQEPPDAIRITGDGPAPERGLGVWRGRGGRGVR
jgi:hypothetical protein